MRMKIMKLMMCLSLSLLVSGCGTLTDSTGDDWEISVSTSVKADDCTAECDTKINQTITTEDEESIDSSGAIEVLKGTTAP